jgi:hypothetical protein
VVAPAWQGAKGGLTVGPLLQLPIDVQVRCLLCPIATPIDVILLQCSCDAKCDTPVVPLEHAHDVN